MWPRVGGQVGPPTPLTPEVVTSPAPAQNASSQSGGSSCLLTSYIFSLHPPFACPLLQYQQPLQMPLEPRNLPRRTYQRMHRRIQNPYRLLSLSERMQNRYRPVLPSLQEEETMEQRSNLEIHELPRPTVMKRETRVYPGLQIQENPTNARLFRNSPGVQRIPYNRWSTSARQSPWSQLDEPDIIITSDVQLQTDDNETGYNSGSLSGHMQSSSNHLHDSTEFESASTQTEPEGRSTDEHFPGVVAAYIDMETDTYPPNDLVVTRITPDCYEALHNEGDHSHVLERYSSPHSKEVVVNQTVLKKSLKVLTSLSVVSVNLCPRPIALPVLPPPSLRARQVANRVIKHARNHKTLSEKDLHCPNCNLFPVLPVTGICGHTRCTKCIEQRGDCPCGAEPPRDLHVNTVIQYLIGKMLPNGSPQRGSVDLDEHSMLYVDAIWPTPTLKSDPPTEDGDAKRRRHSRNGRRAPARTNSAGPDLHARMPMSPEVQFEYARRLVAAGRFRDAAPHFARVAVSNDPAARSARALLAQIVVVLADGCDPRRLARDLFRSVRLQSASSWLKPTDLECVLCYHTFTRPVTTPCGHTYCRTCLERALDYRKVCALCLRPLDDFDLASARETTVLAAALEAIGAAQAPLPPDPDVIPIFVCTVAYPSIPCPLFIFDPRYWLMIRRVLESGSRKFGMVAYERDRNYSDYGTVLEVCDCVHLEDGRSFLSTVGVSRFRVIERDVIDGCDVARIQPLLDITPIDEVTVMDMRVLGSQILIKALTWLNGMNKSVREEIETAFGLLPRLDHDQPHWWDSADGPAWLWWLIAILPLRSEIKILILSTKNLLKRMMAVARTLEAIDQVAITTTATSECEIRSALTNAEEWLERGS